MNEVGDETEKEAALANTRITNQQYLERVIVSVISSSCRTTHYSNTTKTYFFYSLSSLRIDPSRFSFISIFNETIRKIRFTERESDVQNEKQSAKFRGVDETEVVGLAVV